MRLFFDTGWARLYNGDCRNMAELSDESIQTCVTSPPYFGLRDYGIDGQVGLEATVEEYVQAIVEVFREVKRVLRKDGTVWVNLGDSYAGFHGNSRVPDADAPSNKPGYTENMRSTTVGTSGLKPKDLIGIPWRVAFAVQADGWYLRSDIIWSKPNPMPESVTDRPTLSHEYVFLLSKAERYYYDVDAIREPLLESSIARIFQPTFDRQNGGPKDPRNGGEGSRNRSARQGLENLKKAFERGQGRNRRSVWTIATQPYPGAHFATFPEALVKPCILAGTSEKGCCPVCGKPWERVIERGFTAHDGNTDSAYAKGSTANRLALLRQAAREGGKEYSSNKKTLGWRSTCIHDAEPVPCLVLDPFAGSGTTLAVANALGRKAVGYELKEDYCKLALERCRQRPM